MSSTCAMSKPSDALFIPKDVRVEQLLECYNKMNKLRKQRTRRQNKYRLTPQGKERTRIANKRYYYRKNNKYHVEYNPDGEIGRPIEEEKPEENNEEL